MKRTDPPRPRRGLVGGLAGAEAEIAEAMDMRIPAEALERLVRSDRQLRRGLLRYRRPRPGRPAGLDTHERDLLFDAVARYVGFTHWPSNFEGPQPMADLAANVAMALDDGRIASIR